MPIKINKGSAIGELSLTPLIDIVFLLLIFFLVTAKFDNAQGKNELFQKTERRMELRLPEASEAQPLVDPPKEVVINIDSGGRYFVSQKKLSRSQLQSVLEQQQVNNPQTTAIIRSHRDASFRFVITAIDTVKKANITNYIVATHKPLK